VQAGELRRGIPGTRTGRRADTVERLLADLEAKASDAHPEIRLQVCLITAVYMVVLIPNQFWVGVGSPLVRRSCHCDWISENGQVLSVGKSCAAEVSCEAVADTSCAALLAGEEVAWATAANCSDSPSGVVVFGGAVNRVNSEARADDPA